MTFDFEAIKNLKVEEPVSAALVSEEDSKTLIEAISKETQWNTTQSVTALAIICQKGGTSKKAQGTVYAIVDGKRVDLNMIREVMKKSGCKFTLRQWARTHAFDIYKVAAYFGIEGDLAKKIARNSPEVTQDEKFWLSNFQMDNNNCPQNVRDMLMKHYNNLFPGKTAEKN